MSELEWVDLVVLVRVRREDGRYNVGTGFVCGSGRVVTAGHTVFDETLDSGREIRITYSEAARRSLGDVAIAPDGTVLAELVWPLPVAHDGPDCCVLKAPTPNGAPALPFADPERDMPRDFSSWGFPNGAQNSEGGREGFPLSGKRMHAGADALTLQADVRFDTEVRGGWRGYSGAPVVEMRDGCKVVIGMIVQELELFEKPQRLALVPYDRLACCEGFSDAVAPGWQGHAFDENASLERLQASVVGIVADLLEQLDTDLRTRIAGLPSERAPNDLHQLASALAGTPAVAIDRIGELVLELQTTNIEVAGLVGRIGQVLHLLGLDRKDVELVSFISSNGALSALRDSPGLHAATLAKIELLAAAVDGRAPEFLARDAFGGDQKSRYGLELNVPVSGASCLDGIHDAAQDLRQHTAADLFEDAPDEMAEFLAGHEERILEPSEVDRRRGNARSQMRLIARGLRARQTSLGRFYVVASMPENDDARAHIARCLCDILDGIPNLLGFSKSSDIDLLDDELDELVTLYKTVPQQGSGT